jgi:hypothetical protein
VSNKTLKLLILSSLLTVLAACSHTPQTADADAPEILTIFADGTMKLANRSVPAEDVVIYPDGYGGEKAAIKVWLEPLHPPFYRDSIVVRRLSDGETLVSDNQ